MSILIMQIAIILFVTGALIAGNMMLADTEAPPALYVIINSFIPAIGMFMFASTIR